MACARLAAVGGGVGRRPVPGGRIMPLGGDPAARRAQHQQRPRGGRGRAAVRHRAGRHPRGGRRLPRASSTASRRSPTIDGVRFVNDSQGTQPDAVIAALRSFRAADRPDRGRPRQERAARRAGRTSWPSARRRPCSSARRPTRWPACSARRAWAHRARQRPRRRRPPRERDRATASPPTRRRSGDRAAQPGGDELRHVRRLRGTRPRLQGSSRAGSASVAGRGSR